MKANNLITTIISNLIDHSSYKTKKSQKMSFMKSKVFSSFLFLCLLALDIRNVYAAQVITIDPVSDIIVSAISAVGTPVLYTAPNATEYNDITQEITVVPVACSPETGALFALGTTTVACNAISQIDPATTATSYFSIIAVDNEAPILTLQGSSTIELATDDIFVDPGVTAYDAIDGDITSSVISTSTVDVSVPGSYSVFYSVNDMSGNLSTSSRTVIIADRATSTPVSEITILALASLGGTITPTGTSTLSSGDSITYTMTSDDGYMLSDLIVDGTSTQVSPTYTFASTTESHTIEAIFSQIQAPTGGATTTIPNTPLTFVANVTSATHIENSTSTVHAVAIAWDNATGTTPIRGYSYVFDNNATTSPDALVDTEGNNATTTLADGVWYFHIVAIDASMNVSSTTTFGPLVITTPDTESPSIPSLLVTSSSGVAYITWSPSVDNLGIQGYSYIASTTKDLIPDTIVDTAATGTEITLTDGVWYISLLAIDISGNTSGIATTSIRIDTQAPLVTLLGNSEMALYVNDTYNEQGILAQDALDGDVSASMYIQGIVDTTRAGDYILTYTATDASGNISTPISRVVHVIADSVAPSAPIVILTQVSSSSVALTWSTSTDNRGIENYLYAFSTSTTAIPSISVASTTQSITEQLSDGIWYGFVQAVDTSYNVSTTSLSNYIVIDTEAPIITLNGSSTIIVYVGESYTDQGATAYDAIDGDTTSYVVASGTVDTTVVGTYTISYTNIDSHGNVASPVIRTVSVIADSDAPSMPLVTLTQSGSSTVILSWSTSTDNRGIESYLYAFSTSTLDMPTSTIASTTNTITQSLSDGVWYGLVQAVDISHNVSTTSISQAIVIDTQAPILSLNGSSSMTIYKDTQFIDPGVTAYDAIDGDVTSSVTSSSTLDIQRLGVYTITYIVSDSHGNTSAPMIRTVTVVLPPDVTSPTITMNGSSTVHIYEGRPYIELGAIAYDDRDGDITQSIISTTTLDIYQVGTYEIVYTVSDAAGNSASTTRTVVVDQLVYYQVTGSIVSGRGELYSATSTVVVNGTSTILITPNNGYEIASIQINGIDTATTTAVVITNVTSNANVTVTLTPKNNRDTYTIATSTIGRGVISSTSTILEGEDEIIEFTPAYRYLLSRILVNGVDVATSTGMYTITNASTSYDIVGIFVPSIADNEAPSIVTGITSSLATSTIIDSHSIDISWSSSTDNLAGVEGYSYVFDQSSTTIPSSIVNATGTHATAILPYGTYYFHIRSIDYLGNASEVIHYGPFLLSDGNSTITNSYYDGSFYTILAPSIAYGNSIGITGTSTIDASSVSSSTISMSTVLSSTLSQSSVDHTLLHTVFSTTTQIASSTIRNSSFTQSSLTNTMLSHVIAMSLLLRNGILSSSYVENSTVKNINGSNATIINNQASSGIFLLPTGDTYVVATSTPIGDIQNDEPVAAFTVTGNEYMVTFTDASTDPDEGVGVFKDIWNITIDYGDGTGETFARTKLGGEIFHHRYDARGTFTVTYTVRDLYGSVSTMSRQISLPFITTMISYPGGNGFVPLIREPVLSSGINVPIGVPDVFLRPDMSLRNGDIQTATSSLQDLQSKEALPLASSTPQTPKKALSLTKSKSIKKVTTSRIEKPVLQNIFSSQSIARAYALEDTKQIQTTSIKGISDTSTITPEETSVFRKIKSFFATLFRNE